ncbi:MAG: 5'/3'-nucleotidase SurE [Holophagae bacterium]|jgi:5'-nucleotidase
MNRSGPYLPVVISLALTAGVACGGARDEAAVEPATAADAGTPRILVTNDDGYSSEGIAALAEALDVFADVLVLAPRSNESGASQSHRAYKRESIRMYNVAIGDHLTGYAIDGTPTDCVYLGVRIFGAERPFDLVVSGINHGANIGTTYNYSGTVGAAFEALNNGIPGVAVSQSKQRAEYTTAAEFTAAVVQRVLAQPLEEGVLLSVNVPDGAITCVTPAPPGGQRYETTFPPIGESDGDTVYTSERAMIDTPDPGTDLWAFKKGCITLTPLQLDRTHRPMLDRLAGWAPSLESVVN